MSSSSPPKFQRQNFQYANSNASSFAVAFRLNDRILSETHSPPSRCQNYGQGSHPLLKPRPRRKRPTNAKARLFTCTPSVVISLTQLFLAAANDDASPIAPKKLKEDVQPKRTKTSASAKKRKEEEPTLNDDESQGSEAEGDDEARALAKVVDSDAEADDAGPNEDIQDFELPKVSKDITKTSESDDSEPGVVYV